MTESDKSAETMSSAQPSSPEETTTDLDVKLSADEERSVIGGSKKQDTLKYFEVKMESVIIS